MRISRNHGTNVSSSYRVKIGCHKSLLKEFKKDNLRTVFLNDGDEFEIQLFNPTNEEIGVTIKINGESITNNTHLVLRPGEMSWLERYIDVQRRFKFSTYDVPDNDVANYAIRNNGLIEVSFHRLIKNTNITWTYSGPTIMYYNSYGNSFSSPSVGGMTNDVSGTLLSTTFKDDVSYINTSNANVSYLSNKVSDDNNFSTKKTGRIEQGNISNQSFGNSYLTFEQYAYYTESIKILPMEYKPISTNDIQKMYCPECGRKLKSKFKFCPYCGTKL